MREYDTFEKFWPYYLSQHQNRVNRWLHAVGSLCTLVALVFLLLYKAYSWLPLLVIVGYGPAWIGHFFIEKNRPATLGYPFYSLLADFKMTWFTLTGKKPRI